MKIAKLYVKSKLILYSISFGNPPYAFHAFMAAKKQLAHTLLQTHCSNLKVQTHNLLHKNYIGIYFLAMMSIFTSFLAPRIK